MALRSRRVPARQMLPPNFHHITLRFLCKFFKYKTHRHCPRPDVYCDVKMKRTFRSAFDAIQSLILLKELFWCAHCRKGLFFSPSVDIPTYFRVAGRCVCVFSQHVGRSRRRHRPRQFGAGQPQLIAESHTISTHHLSIVDRLAARSLTGRCLQILVHQHFGYCLHLEWSGDPNNERSTKFMERRFHRWDATESFSSQLCSLGLKGLCTCAYEASYQPHNAKAPKCRRGPLYASRKHLLLPKWELKSMEDYAVFNLCECNITSTAPDRLKW